MLPKSLANKAQGTSLEPKNMFFYWKVELKYRCFCLEMLNHNAFG
ncbi:hypothetical protein HMPREF0645_2315 [Hallella bergensis DSM 17361]|uniref:Uncharacterized protein n=1 Tax=Hallella bergensis DSM 17361 TaxID=585502 RepID=D1PZD0_9BACT|nr:hypothetical protein HMPREF0645_2315 [Hallella bergensis DSM 17361]